MFIWLSSLQSYNFACVFVFFLNVKLTNFMHLPNVFTQMHSLSLITKIFWFSSIQLILKGVFIGNLIALSFCFLQTQFKLIPLDAKNYYMSAVPILWDWSTWGLVNVGSLLIVGLVILVPIYSTVNMQPVKAIRFD